MLALKVLLAVALVCIAAEGYGHGGFGYGHGGYGDHGGHAGYGGNGLYIGHGGYAGHGYGYGGHHDDLSVPTSYKFEYGVKDPHTHDLKSQWEHGDGHNVKGAYELTEPDGSHRLVEYHADKGGFHAHVTKHANYHHPKGGHSYHNMNLHTHH